MGVMDNMNNREVDMEVIYDELLQLQRGITVPG